jgi:hypothetical protein
VGIFLTALLLFPNDPDVRVWLKTGRDFTARLVDAREGQYIMEVNGQLQTIDQGAVFSMEPIPSIKGGPFAALMASPSSESPDASIRELAQKGEVIQAVREALQVRRRLAEDSSDVERLQNQLLVGWCTATLAARDGLNLPKVFHTAKEFLPGTELRVVLEAALQRLNEEIEIRPEAAFTGIAAHTLVQEFMGSSQLDEEFFARLLEKNSLICSNLVVTL